MLTFILENNNEYKELGKQKEDGDLFLTFIHGWSVPVSSPTIKLCVCVLQD